MKNKTQKGFTLIELLVVIAIIAILAVVVVLTLNPAQLLAQARDSNRISDFATLKSALSLYGTDVSTTTPMNGANLLTTGNGAYALYTGNQGTSTATSSYNTSSTWGFLGGETSVVSTTARTVNGLGWIPVNLNAISSGAPISVLPVDPVNSGSLMYMYAATTTFFKLATKMESTKYQYNGPNDVVSTDGGNSSTTYEQGSNLTTL